MRLDLALCRLRFARTRSLARAMAECGHIRINGHRATSGSTPLAVGDVLTLPRGDRILVAAIIALPERRGPASEAQTCYQVLDPSG